MNRLPLLLIYSRLFIGAFLVVISWCRVPHYPAIAVVLITVGLLTDVFDGIIARQLNISTGKLRRLDSTIDQFFWAMVVGATYVECGRFFTENAVKLLTLLGLEGSTYVVCFLKFRKEIATHSWGAKLWVLVSFIALVQVILTCQSQIIFIFCFYVGVITRLEIVAIIILLKNWANDVPTFYHALLLRHGKAIKRHKLFNG